jgi:glutamyl-tRNA reductase
MLLMGVDRRHAPLPAIAVAGADPAGLAARIRSAPGVRGVVVVATCARVEAYVEASRFHEVQHAFAEAVGLPGRHARGVAALEHLFRVTAGLESAIVGETEVLGQVRRSIRDARAAGTTTASLDRAFDTAVRVGRSARALMAGHPGLAAVALDLAPRGSTTCVLVIGTGDLARDVISEARHRGLRVLVHSPSGRPAPGAAEVVDAPGLEDGLVSADLVVSASGRGPRPLQAPVLEAARSRRRRPLLLVDLAGREDITALPGWTIVRLADLARGHDQAQAATRLVRAEAERAAPRIVDGELDALIVRLRSHITERLVEAWGPAAVGDATVRRAVNALLHEPTERARRAAAAGDLARYRACVEALFDLDPAA